MNFGKFDLMTSLVNPNTGIEGKKICGQSRDPLKYTRMLRIVEHRLHEYKDSFNVKSRISEALGLGEQRIDPDLSLNPADEVDCDCGLIRTKKAKFSQCVRASSGRHQSNFWDFNNHSTFTITKPHHEIYNAIQKRKIKLLQDNQIETNASRAVTFVSI